MIPEVEVTEISVYIAPVVAAAGSEVASNQLGAAVCNQNHW
jgi:hypothetical protein